MIIDFNNKKVELEHQKDFIFAAFSSFFKSIEKELDLPPFIYAEQAYKENIKGVKDVRRWYKKLMEVK